MYAMATESVYRNHSLRKKDAWYSLSGKYHKNYDSIIGYISKLDVDNLYAIIIVITIVGAFLIVL